MVDPIVLEVVGNAFLSASDEMGMTLIRTAYSTNIKERRDCSTAVFDAKGEVIVQAEHIPVHLGSLIGIADSILKKYPLADIHPGDMFMTNDPYSGGGTHLPDITVAAPVFFDEKLVAFVANIAHHSDIGGKVAGSISGDTTSIFQEGLRIPLIKIMTKGTLTQDFIEIILTNCRTPKERRGDISAQLASNQTGVQRVIEIYRRYGHAEVSDCLNELKNYAARKFRSAIRTIPDGVYQFTDYMDDDGIESKRIPIRVAITIQDDHISLDFTGSGKQVKGGINVVYNAALATVLFALKAIIDPSIPSNSGYYSAVELKVPKGTIVNALPPAAVAARTDTCQRIADVIFGAMAQAVPERVIAGCNSAVTAVMFSGIHPQTQEFYVYLESLAGGSGARPNKDGLEGVQVHITNSSNLPVECLEMEYPLRVDRYELIPASGGAGKYRGGLALRRDIRIVDHVCNFSSHGDRQQIPPWGLFGGKPGSVGKFVVNPETPAEKVLPSGKLSDIILQPGDILSVQTPGAGGYGPPEERDSQLIEDDIKNGKVHSF